MDYNIKQRIGIPTMNYKIKKLIKGYKIKPSLRNLTLIAIPFKYKGVDIEVKYNKEKMVIKENTPLLHHQIFDDKFRKNRQYTLYYYEWIEKNNQIALF
tara:strand:+ start:456 stop:752 length:297 start_codon:yes stop_codon:yes gene_type:complete